MKITSSHWFWGFLVGTIGIMLMVAGALLTPLHIIGWVLIAVGATTVITLITNVVIQFWLVKKPNLQKTDSEEKNDLQKAYREIIKIDENNYDHAAEIIEKYGVFPEQRYNANQISEKSKSPSFPVSEYNSFIFNTNQVNLQTFFNALKQTDITNEINYNNVSNAIIKAKENALNCDCIKNAEDWLNKYMKETLAELEKFDGTIKNESDYEKAIGLIVKIGRIESQQNTDMYIDVIIAADEVFKEKFEAIQAEIIRYENTIRCKYEDLQEGFEELLGKIRLYDSEREKELVEMAKKPLSTDFDSTKKILDFIRKSPITHPIDPTKLQVDKVFNDDSTKTLISYIAFDWLEKTGSEKISQNDVATKYFSVLLRGDYPLVLRNTNVKVSNKQLTIIQDRTTKTFYFEKPLPEVHRKSL